MIFGKTGTLRDTENFNDIRRALKSGRVYARLSADFGWPKLPHTKHCHCQRAILVLISHIFHDKTSRAGHVRQEGGQHRPHGILKKRKR